MIVDWKLSDAARRNDLVVGGKKKMIKSKKLKGGGDGKLWEIEETRPTDWKL